MEIKYENNQTSRITKRNDQETNLESVADETGPLRRCQPMNKRRSRPVATVCRRRRLPGHSPTGVSPIGRGDQRR
jgi:hypothetical protein